MIIQFFKQTISVLFSVYLLVPSFAMDSIDVPSELTLKLFQESPKYLVHIGFSNGLPENGIMRPGHNDAVNYFSVNGPLPSNNIMPWLDNCSFAVILKLTPSIMSRIVGFHVTEVLLAGEITLAREECTIIAPQGTQIPSILADKIEYYDGKGLEIRTQKTMECLKNLKAYPICMEKNENGWDNNTIATAVINEVSVNVNLKGKPDYFSNILKSLPNISYTCPAGSGQFNDKTLCWEIYGIGHLSEIKRKRKYMNVTLHHASLMTWINTLTHLGPEARTDFISRVNTLS